MARGSGAGTGVIVALVVSVVCNVGLLTITFMMYSGKAEALQNEAEAQAEMTQFIRSSDRTSEFDRLMGAAESNQQSLYKYLQGRRGEVAQFVAGNPNADVTEMRSSLGLAEGDVVTVGITDHAQGELGDIVFVELPEAGDTIAKGDSFGTIEAVKTVAEMYAPLTGEIVEAFDAETIEVNILCHMRAFRRGDADLVTGTFAQLTGESSTSVNAFLEEHRAAFGA